MVKIFFYFILALIVLISIYLSVFELLLHSFHTPLGSELKEPIFQEATWTYLLHQKYITLIDLDHYTLHERRHLLDVKNILETTYRLWIYSIALSILILFTTFRTIIKYIIHIGVILNILFILLSFNFLKSFDFFHSLFFKSNSWIFSQDSILIEYFPLIYFQEFFILFFLLSFTLLFLLKVIITHSKVSQW